MSRNSGAAAKAERAFEKLAEKYGTTLITADRRIETLDEQGCTVKSIRIRLPGMEHADYLVTVTAEIDGEPKVAFHGGDDLGSVIVGVLNRLYNNTLKWKDDEYANR